jgi:hypothetical protein
MRIFVTHASADVVLLKEFVALLKEIGVPSKDIFCTSLPGHGVPAGNDFKTYIATQFHESDTVIAIVSASYYASAFSMCELGAVWITADKRFFPFLVPPVDFRNLRAVLAGVQCLQIEKAADLSELRDHLNGNLEHSCGTPAWEESRERFLAKLSGILTKLPAAITVETGIYEKALKELDEYKKEVKTQKAKVVQLQNELDAVSKLKDAAEVRKVSQKYQNDEESFHTAIGAASHPIKQLSLVVREGLFNYIRGEDFSPEWDSWGEALKREIQSGRLYSTGESDEFLRIDRNDPDVAEALGAFEELQAFMSSISKEFKRGYKDRYGEQLDPTLRPFWRRWFKLPV